MLKKTTFKSDLDTIKLYEIVGESEPAQVTTTSKEDAPHSNTSGKNPAEELNQTKTELPGKEASQVHEQHQEHSANPNNHPENQAIKDNHSQTAKTPADENGENENHEPLPMPQPAHVPNESTTYIQEKPLEFIEVPELIIDEDGKSAEEYQE